MDRFCGKCGARLDERTGLCPVCDPTADYYQHGAFTG